METMPTTRSQTRSFTTIFLIEMWQRFGFYGMQALIRGPQRASVMKKILILILAMALASSATFADDEEGKQGGDDRMARMQQNLGLSDEQVTQMRQIRDNGGDKEKILAVLTDEQLALMKERRGKMKSRGKKGGRRAPAKDVQNSEKADG